MNVYDQYIIFHQYDYMAAILNILAYFSQTKPEMHLYLNFNAHTHHKDSKKPYVINVHSRWHLAPSEAGLIILYIMAMTNSLHSTHKPHYCRTRGEL